MRRLFAVQLLIGGCGVFAISGVAAAQTCAGFVAFADRPVQAGAGVTAGSGFTSGAVELAVGGKHLFGSVEGDWTHYSDVDASAPSVGGEFGGEIAIGSSRRLFVCPVVSVFKTFGPDVDGVTFRDLQAALGANVGFVAFERPSLAIVPTAGIAAAVDHESATAGSIEETDTSGFGVIEVGIGFLFSRRATVLPNAQFPIHLSGAHPQGGVSFRLSF